MGTTTRTTAGAAAAGSAILAIDLGKYKSVACLYQGDPQTAQFISVSTDEAHLRQLFARYRPQTVVIEACLLAGWVYDLCAACGLPCEVANTASEAWKFKHLKRKTDKDDALRLAQLFAQQNLDQEPCAFHDRCPMQLHLCTNEPPRFCRFNLNIRGSRTRQSAVGRFGGLVDWPGARTCRWSGWPRSWPALGTE
jgi:hypothetical protein